MRLIFFLLVLPFIDVPSVVAQRVTGEQIDRDLNILLISDLNGSYGSVDYNEHVHQVIGEIDQIQPDIILCGGDMVAGQMKSLTPDSLRAMWAGFNQAVLGPISAREIPFAFTMGNHDASPNYHNDREAASEFWMANKDRVKLTFVDQTHYPYYFSYIKNNVFIISWDASSARIPDEVKHWMEKQLTSPIAQKARVRILLGHLPLYAIVESKNKPGEVLDNADETLTFIREHGVDMYISGHQHAYFPAQKGGVQLLHSGCLGGGPRPLLGSTAPPYRSYALIRIPKDAGIDYRNIQGRAVEGHRPVSLKSLPDTIQGFNGTVKRTDLF